jgi:hypothetical protein
MSHLAAEAASHHCHVKLKRESCGGTREQWQTTQQLTIKDCKRPTNRENKKVMTNNTKHNDNNNNNNNNYYYYYYYVGVE